MAEKPAIPVIRAGDSRLKALVSNWLNDNLKPSVNMILIEGLPYSGKSTLHASLSLDDACKFEFDQYLPSPCSAETRWIDYILQSKAIRAIENSCATRSRTLIEGPAAGFLLQELSPKPDRHNMLRIYIKEMSTSVGQITWFGREFLKDFAAERRPFWRSVYDHHDVDKPWMQADLVIERIPDEGE
jgi:hypothetical protein